MAGTSKPGDTGGGSNRKGVERSHARSTRSSRQPNDTKKENTSSGSSKMNPKTLEQEKAAAMVAAKEQQNQIVRDLAGHHERHKRQQEEQARKQQRAYHLELAKKQDAVRQRQAEAGKKKEFQVKEKLVRMQEAREEADKSPIFQLETIAEGAEEVNRYSNDQLASSFDKTTAQLPTTTPAKRVPQRRHPTTAAKGNTPLKRAGLASNQQPTAKAPRLAAGQHDKSPAVAATAQAAPKAAETNSAQPKLPPKRSKAPLQFVRVIGNFAGEERHVQVQAHARIEYRLQTENGTTTSGSQETKQYFIQKAQIGNECEVRLRTIDGKHFCILPFVSLWTSCVCSEVEQQGAVVHISFNNDHTFQYNQLRIWIPKPCQHGMGKWTFAKAFLNIFENRG